jgi:hypothetical protein
MRIFRKASSDSLDEDELGQLLLGLAALERDRPWASPSLFPPAFENVRRRRWPEARADIDKVLKSLEPPLR